MACHAVGTSSILVKTANNVIGIIMSDYCPDLWVMLKITNDTECVYKVLASWYGGFVNGDSWKLNSGVTGVTIDENCYLFTGSSGSVYQCHQNNYGMSGYTTGILNSWIQKLSDNNSDTHIELLSPDTNFANIAMYQISE